jgi:CHASE3 domain sensor protein
MAEIEFQRWQPLFLQALQEPLGSSHLLQRVKEAETVISRRIQQLRTSPNGKEERQELGDALGSLRYMKTENFKHTSGYNSDQLGAESAIRRHTEL